MEVLTHFKAKWAKSYVGLMDDAWLDVVLPASAMLIDSTDEFLYVRLAHVEDVQFFEKFNSYYGVDLINVWAGYYHWSDSSYGQPTLAELREFAQKYERMVHDSIAEVERRDAAIAISKMSHTPMTQEIDECLEMVGMSNKVRGILTFYFGVNV